ncbi:MAG: TlpA family protein disulfide reductase [Flavobacteriaceae bacterium]|nr:TlpA family protein disulfide reductase [Flavobacteriaceae bacterium]
MKNLVFLMCLLCSTVTFSQKELPKATVKTLQGTETNLVELSKKSKFMVVSLWATWCIPCRNELTAINDVYEDWKEEVDVLFYAISIDDSRTAKSVRPMVNGKNWDFTVLLDTNNNLKRELSANSIPLTLVIKNGKIIYKHSGYTSGAEDDIFEILQKNN